MLFLPQNFEVSQMDLYDGSKSPMEHLENLKTHMKLHMFLGEILCRAFPLTLEGMTLRLQDGSRVGNAVFQ